MAGNNPTTCRRGCGFVLGVLLCLTQAASAGLFGPDRPDKGDLLAGQAALEDGLYELARKHLENALKELDDAGEKARVSLLLVEALAGLAEFAPAEARLASLQAAVRGGPLEAKQRYWMARLDHLQKRQDAALQQLRELPGAFPGHEILPHARLLEGHCLLALGETDEAIAVFDAALESGELSTEAAEGLLDGTAALLREHRWADAEARLRKLVEGPPDSLASQRARLWLGQLLIDEQFWDEAREPLKWLTENDLVEPALKATAMFALSEIEEAQNRPEAALELLAGGLQIAVDPVERTQAQMAQGRLLIQTGQQEQGLALLRTAVSGQPSEGAAGTAQLHFANVLYEQRLWEQALGEYQRYLEAFSGSQQDLAAMEGRAWCLFEMARLGEAAQAFERASLATQKPGDKARLLFKAADARFADLQFQPAMEIYQQVLDTFPDSEWRDNARYQIALCKIRKELFGDAEALLKDLTETSENPELAEAAAMRLARLQEERGQWEAAVSEYEAVMSRFPEGERFPEALYRRAVGRYRLGQFAEANADFDQILSRFPDSVPAEQAFYMRGFAHYMMGETEKAVETAGEFLQRFPASRWAPRVGIWLGEYYYNLGRYEEAETRYVDLANAFPLSAEADRSLLEAARCAYARKEYLQAIDLVKRLAQSFPSSANMPEARFLHGDALTELGDFSSAILAFEEILKRWPESYLAAAAQGRIGDCHFTLGSKEGPERIKLALSHYKAVADRPGINVDQRLQALFKVARCREGTEEAEAAFEAYMKVVDETRDAWNRGEPAGTVWFTRAAFAAAALMENQKKWREAIRIYKRVVDSGISAAEEAERRIAKIKMEQLILL